MYSATRQKVHYQVKPVRGIPPRLVSDIGATSPLPRVTAKVPSPSDLQTFAIVRCKPVVS
jgi:hypothetical protein